MKQEIQESFLNPNHVQSISQDQEGQGNQVTLSQIHSLFSDFNPELITVLDGIILGVSKTSYRKILL